MFAVLAEFELSFLYALQELHTPVLDWLMVKITSLGDAGWFWITLGLFLSCIRKTRRTGIAMLISVFIGFLLGNVWMKHLFERQRPCWIDPAVQLLVENPHDFSFPSGHSMASFAGAVSIVLNHKRWGVPAVILAVLIACSRLYLFVHFPTDVLVGALMGAVIAWGVHWMLTNRPVMKKTLANLCGYDILHRNHKK